MKKMMTQTTITTYNNNGKRTGIYATEAEARQAVERAAKRGWNWTMKIRVWNYEFDPNPSTKTEFTKWNDN